MAKFKVHLPDTSVLSGENSSWESVEFHSLSLWGNGKQGKNLWGFPHKGADKASVKPLEAKQENGNWVLKIEALNPSTASGVQLAFITRYKYLNGKTKSYGVFATTDIDTIPYT
jgi:hypothetical protein